MALIRYKRGVYCDKCDKLVPRGGDVYYTNDGFYLCEACFDKRQSQAKDEAKTEVNTENFDLEEET